MVIMRSFALAVILLALAVILLALAAASPACPSVPPSAASAPSPSLTLRGVVADATGAIVSGAEVDLIEANGTVTSIAHTTGDGSFRVVAPHAGSFTLVISESALDALTARTGKPRSAGEGKA